MYSRISYIVFLVLAAGCSVSPFGHIMIDRVFSFSPFIISLQLYYDRYTVLVNAVSNKMRSGIRDFIVYPLTGNHEIALSLLISVHNSAKKLRLDSIFLNLLKIKRRSIERSALIFCEYFAKSCDYQLKSVG